MAEPAAAAPKPSSSVKLVLLGEAAVGKVNFSLDHFSFTLLVIPSNRFSWQSSLVLRFVNNDFQENKEPTIGGTSSWSKRHMATHKRHHSNSIYSCISHS